MPEKRMGHSAVLIEDLIYVFGGIDDNYTIHQDLLSFSPENQTWNSINALNSPPSPRTFHAAAAINHTMYIFGGYSNATYLGDLWSFDTITKEWKQLNSSGPLKRRSSTIVVHDK